MKKKKIDLFVIAIMLYWIIFVVIAWVTFWVKNGVPESLIQYGLGGGAIELVMTAAIEIFTGRKSKDE